MRVKAEIILKKKYGIDYSQFLVLHVASEMKESSQNDIAQNSWYTGAWISKITDILSHKGLLYKKIDPLNRRSNKISMTQSWEKLIKQVRQSLESEFDKLLSPEDKKAMSYITNKLITSLM